MDIVEKVREAGIVGAGGAGFPTHVKINCKAEYVIANGAECEPLLRVDQQVMAVYAQELIDGMRAVMEQTGAQKGTICLKSHYHDAVNALNAVLQGDDRISLHPMKSYYPAGDEQQMVYEVTGRVVPTGGLPLDVGAVVCNVSTLVNIARAMHGEPVTDKFVTVGGEVENPATFCVPVGTSVGAIIAAAGGPVEKREYILILGGPCMGALSEDWDTPVTKTTGGVLVIKKDHPLISKKENNSKEDMKLAQAVCCQCSMCTQLCPRNALGLRVEPHKAMRAAANAQGALLGDINGVFSCCDCGICTYFACNFGLKPSKMMGLFKQSLGAAGVRPEKEVYGQVDPGLELKKIPVTRMVSRMGIKKYDVPAPLLSGIMQTECVKIPLKMHIGAPSVPVVGQGNAVHKGQLIADIPAGALGAKIHASISGTVAEITDTYIEIRSDGGVR